MREDRLIDCEDCGQDNMFIEHGKMTCRVCGHRQEVPEIIPSLSYIKQLIFDKCGRDLEHIRIMKERFLFDEEASTARKNSVYYNILIYIIHGSIRQKK